MLVERFFDINMALKYLKRALRDLCVLRESGHNFVTFMSKNLSTNLRVVVSYSGEISLPA